MAGLLGVLAACTKPEDFTGKYTGGTLGIKTAGGTGYRSSSDAVMHVKQNGSTATVTIEDDFVKDCVFTVNVSGPAGTVDKSSKCTLSGDVTRSFEDEQLKVKNSILYSDRGRVILDINTSREGGVEDKDYELSFFSSTKEGGTIPQ